MQQARNCGYGKLSMQAMGIKLQHYVCLLRHLTLGNQWSSYVYMLIFNYGSKWATSTLGVVYAHMEGFKHIEPNSRRFSDGHSTVFNLWASEGNVAW